MSKSAIAERRLDAAGIKARILEEGSGVPVLLFHGGALGSSADVWERNMARLAGHGLRAIAVDLPGHGGSDAPLELTEAYRRRFALDLLDALGIERAGIVGHSSAGGLAMGLGFGHADRVSRVLILGTHSLLPPLPEGEPAGEGGGRASNPPTIEDVRAVLVEQLFDHSLITPEVLQIRLRAGAARRPTGERNQVHDDRAAERARETPAWQRLDQLPVPLAMMYGMNDRPTTVPRVALLRERYPTLDLQLLDRCGHIIQWDQAAAFEATAARFFAA